MQYASVIRGQFCSRPNRFLAVVRIGGQEEIVHVKNTGRCRELLIPECTVYLSRSDNPNRKTKYDLIVVEKQTASAHQSGLPDSQRCRSGMAGNRLTVLCERRIPP